MLVASDEEFQLPGIIDWEYTNVEPAEFTYTAPRWLLFEIPETWEPDLNEILRRYTPRLDLFLKVLRACENEQIQRSNLKESQRLSGRMARSIDSGLFWFCLATRRSFMFDDIYWTFIGEKYFAPLNTCPSPAELGPLTASLVPSSPM